MNHNFVASKLDEKKCITCARVVIMHTPFAECESCGNQGEVEIINGMALCASCFDIEKSIITTAPQPVEPVKIDTPTLITKLATAIKIDESLTTSADFFNNETTSIVELEATIKADESIPADQKYFKLASIIKDRYQHYRKILFEIKSVEVEIASRERAQQYYLNQLASKLRVEEREKLKLEDITYTPKAAPVKIPKVRLSAEDRMAEGYAKLMFAPKDEKGNVLWDSIGEEQRKRYIEQAKRLMNQGLKESK